MMSQHIASAWVRRFVPLICRGGRVLDLAAGGGRHARLLIDMGFAVTAVDRDIEELRSLAPLCDIRAIDLENGTKWPLGIGYDAIVVTNYLHRPLFAPIAAALAPGGVLIYETFMLGNERLGRPRNPDFLLRPDELLSAFAALTIVAFEQGEVVQPRPAILQRIAAVNGPLAGLPADPDVAIAAPQE
ncbi:MAG TPA: methyltransferase domain-containing protein [Stellaceae bacterium]|nr:methyltransferase domain-containing protein [Stellaceae bacterium]